MTMECLTPREKLHAAAVALRAEMPSYDEVIKHFGGKLVLRLNNCYFRYPCTICPGHTEKQGIHFELPGKRVVCDQCGERYDPELWAKYQALPDYSRWGSACIPDEGSPDGYKRRPWTEDDWLVMRDLYEPDDWERVHAEWIAERAEIDEAMRQVVCPSDNVIFEGAPYGEEAFKDFAASLSEAAIARLCDIVKQVRGLARPSLTFPEIVAAGNRVFSPFA